MSSGELVADHKPAEPARRSDLVQFFNDGGDISACFVEVRLRFRVQLVDVGDQNGYGSQGAGADDAQGEGGEQSGEDKRPAEREMRVFHVCFLRDLRLWTGVFPVHLIFPQKTAII